MRLFLKVLINVIALYFFINSLVNHGGLYRLLLIGSSVICILVLLVAQRIAGSEKILYSSPYIFIGLLLVNFALVPFLGWDIESALAFGSIWGVVLGALFMPNVTKKES